MFWLQTLYMVIISDYFKQSDLILQRKTFKCHVKKKINKYISTILTITNKYSSTCNLSLFISHCPCMNSIYSIKHVCGYKIVTSKVFFSHHSGVWRHSHSKLYNNCYFWGQYDDFATREVHHWPSQRRGKHCILKLGKSYWSKKRAIIVFYMRQRRVDTGKLIWVIPSENPSLKP